MATKVKICGLTEPAGVAAALAAGADYLGFVFFPPSPRHVSIEHAAGLAQPGRGRAGIVALSVDADDATLDAIVGGLGPDLLQFHGGEPPQRLREVRRRYAIPVVKALGIRTGEDVARAHVYAPLADYLLFDAKPPADATRPGGLGRAFDWTLLSKLDASPPYMLSGGLDRSCVGSAIGTARPHAVDVSSGVESAPGIKDPELVRAFIEEVRRVDGRLAGTEQERVVT